LLIYLARNRLYYGNFLSTGYDIQIQQIYPNIKYGVISWHYIWPNFVVDFLRWPTFHYAGPFDLHPKIDLLLDGVGTCIFASTPLLAIFIFSPQGKTPQTWLRTALWVTVAILLLTMLTFCAAGWFQVGARYLLALYPPLFLLLAQRAAPLNTRWIGLAGLSILINLLLAHTFWLVNPSNLYIAKCAGLVLVACIIAILILQWQKRHHKQSPPLAPATTPADPTPDDKSTAQQSALKTGEFVPS
jgi:hypothetical protein